MLEGGGKNSNSESYNEDQTLEERRDGGEKAFQYRLSLQQDKNQFINISLELEQRESLKCF